MPLEERTIRDRIYSDFLKEHGALTNSELNKKAAEHPHFREMSADALEKDIDRFVTHYKYLGIVERNEGKIEWLPRDTKRQGQPTSEVRTEPTVPGSRESRHEAVQKLMRGMANGTIILKDKSPHKELNRVKGEIYDEFMRDIDLYNAYGKSLGVSDILETRIYNTALKLRAYGFMEEKESLD
jgi:hypothetical protein